MAKRFGPKPERAFAPPWIVACTTSVALIVGCTIGPDYKRPPVAEPQVFRGQPTSEVASLADLPWWEAFQDATLKGLIQEALGSNYDVRIAAARVQEARARAGVARSEFYPSIGYGVRASETRNQAALLGLPGGQPSTTDLYLGALAASWELDIWGRIRRSSEAAQANFLATEHARRGVWLTLISDLAQAYFELLALEVRLQIARNSADAFQSTHDLFQERLQFGVASNLQTSRAEGALGAAQATIPETRNEIIAKENQISILLGKTPGPIPRGTAMYAQPVAPTVPAGLPSALLERRPDIRQAEQQLVRANALVGVAKADFFPKLSLTSLVGTASPDLSGLVSASSLVWQIAAGLAGPIFQGGRILDSYRAQVAVWEQAKLQYEQAVLTALREVSDALASLGNLAEAESGQNRSVKALEEAVEHSTERYRSGLANYYEVLEAQQQLFPAQNTQAQIRRDRLLAYVRLYKALGGGWSLTEAQWSDPPRAAAADLSSLTNGHDH